VSETSAPPSFSAHIVRRAVTLVAIGIVLYAAIAFFADAGKIAGALAVFWWPALPAAIALTLCNYGLRFAKWQYFLHVVDAEVPARPSLGIFLVGLGMAITPGKVGEFFKSHLLREAFGIPMSVSAPIVVADRLTDLLAMLILALGGLVSREGGPALAAAVFAGCLGGIQLLRWRTGAEWALDILGRAPILTPRASHLRSLYESAYLMFAPRPLTLATLLSTIAWFAECLALAVILYGLGHAASWSLVGAATSSYALATLIGAITLLPGGLGAQELSLASLLAFALIGISREAAAFATILVRLVTFWFGIAIGLTALGLRLRADRLLATGAVPIAED